MIVPFFEISVKNKIYYKDKPLEMLTTALRQYYLNLRAISEKFRTTLLRIKHFQGFSKQIEVAVWWCFLKKVPPGPQKYLFCLNDKRRKERN